MRRRMARVLGERLREASALLESLRRGALRRDGERLLREPAMRVDHLRARMETALQRSLEAAALRLNEAKAGHRAIHPLRVLERREEHLKSLRGRLERLGTDRLEREGKRLAGLKALLRTLGPESAFQRGFSITVGEDGSLLRSVKQVKKGGLVRTKLADGEIVSRREG